MPEVKDIIDEIRSEFEKFKSANDQRLAEVEQYGQATAETQAKVDRANAAITALQAKLDQMHREQSERILELENRLNRPLAGGLSRRQLPDDKLELYASWEGTVKGQEVDPAHVDLEFIGNYQAAFRDWVKHGTRAKAESIRLLNEMSVGSNPAGGYWVDPDMTGRIVEFIRETTPIRQFATVTTIESGDALEGDYDLDEAGTGGWVGEGTARTGDTATPEIWRWRIPVHEQYAEPRTTQRNLDMTSRSNIEDWLVRKVARRFERDENSAFVNGNGVAKPRGFLTYPAGVPATTSPAAYQVVEQVPSGAAAAITADGLIDLVFSLKSGYRQGAIFGGTRLTEAEVRKLKDANGQYLWQPDFTERAQARLLGFPWVEMPDLPEIASNALPIVFGNFSEAYQIVDLGGIRMLRDELTTKGRVKFYTTKYVGGDVINFEAIKLQKVSA